MNRPKKLVHPLSITLPSRLNTIQRIRNRKGQPVKWVVDNTGRKYKPHEVAEITGLAVSTIYGQLNGRSKKTIPYTYVHLL